jgi:hypothetical protein
MRRMFHSDLAAAAAGIATAALMIVALFEKAAPAGAPTAPQPRNVAG